MSYTSDITESYVDDQVSQANGIIKTAQALYKEAMQELSDVIAGLTDLYSVVVPDPNADNFVLHDFNTAAPVFNISNDAEYEEPVFGNYVDVPVIIGVSLPTEPSNVMPVVDIPFIEQLYYSNLLETFKTYLVNGLSGGTGITDSYEDAIYERDRLRRQLETTRLVNELGEKFSARGFARPDGAYAAAYSQVLRDQTLVLSEQSRDVMIKRVELEQAFTMAVMQAIPQVESLVIDYHEKAQGRKFMVASGGITNGIEVWKSTWQRYRDLMDAAKIEAELSIAQVNAAVETNKGVATINALRLEEAKTKADLEIKKLEADIQVLSGKVSAFEAEVSAYKVTEDVRIRGYEADIGKEVSFAELSIKGADASIQALINAKSVLVEAAKANSSVTGQVLASALNSINTAISYGYSGSVGVSYNHDETKTKAGGAATINYHYFDETGV